MELVPPSEDSWAPARAAMLAADPRMASLVDADPTLEPRHGARRLADRSVGRARIQRGRATTVGGCDQGHPGTARGVARRASADTGGAACNGHRNLRGVGLSRAKTVYLRDLAERLSDGRLDLERLRSLDDGAARAELMHAGE